MAACPNDPGVAQQQETAAQKKQEEEKKKKEDMKQKEEEDGKNCDQQMACLQTKTNRPYRGSNGLSNAAGSLFSNF